MVISYIILIEHYQQHYLQEVEKKYHPITKLINKEYYRYGLTQNLESAIKDMGLEFIRDTSKIDHIFQTKDIELVFKRENRLHIIALFSDKQYNYVYFQTPFEEFLVKDKNPAIANDYKTITIVFAIILLTLLLVSLTIYNKLYPLKHLKNAVKNLGECDENIDFDFIKNGSKDEVALLAFEFKKSTEKLNSIKEARNIFIRNIMHELKTPIAKGRFLVELPADEKNKNLLRTVFYRLESLIGEFASIEEIIAKKDSIETKPYFIEDIIENAIDLLFIDRQKVEYTNKELRVNVNFKLFSIAVKNLIDNAIKYSKDKKVNIEIKDNKLLFISNGEKLANDLEHYYEPFNQNEKDHKNSFGLGLYIVHNILNAHNMKLEYEHKEGNNIFMIVL